MWAMVQTPHEGITRRDDTRSFLKAIFYTLKEPSLRGCGFGLTVYGLRSAERFPSGGKPMKSNQQTQKQKRPQKDQKSRTQKGEPVQDVQYMRGV